MKDLFLFITVYLILLLAVFSVLFVVGCQENNITDPLYKESPENQAVTNVTADKNITPDKDIPVVLKFEKELLSPYLTVGECFIVAGEVRVDHKVWQLDTIPPNPQYRVTVGLCMDAEVNCSDENARNRWFIRCDTKNTLYISGDEAVPITKYYTIEGRSDRMQLVVNYKVTLDGVSITNMKLRIPRYKVNEIINNF